MNKWLKCTLLCMAAVPAIAGATWSIVAADPATGEVGAAGATCGPSVAAIARVVPGKGAVVAQGLSSFEARDHARDMLRQGKSAKAIIDAVTSSEVDQSFFIVRQLRQYGVVSLQDGTVSVAGATGALTWPSRGSREASGAMAVGNMLASGNVLDKTLERFVNTPKACGLAVALLDALEAGAREGGDSRCSAQQSALSAFVLVAQPDDAPTALTVRVIAPDQQAGSGNPVLMLRDLLRAQMAEKSILPKDCAF
jgi:uncharacterized Ntn-hydrolase superfamily protein